MFQVPEDPMEPLYPGWAARVKWASQDLRVRQWTTTKWVFPHLQEETCLPALCQVVDQEAQVAHLVDQVALVAWDLVALVVWDLVALVASPGVSRILPSCMVVEPI